MFLCIFSFPGTDTLFIQSKLVYLFLRYSEPVVHFVQISVHNNALFISFYIDKNARCFALFLIRKFKKRNLSVVL